MKWIFIGISALLGFAIVDVASANENECYDVKVRAKPTAQIPTVYPQSEDPNVIIMAWPWFVDLKVERVIDGALQAKNLTVLAVLHTYYVGKTRTWLLRKNSAGSYNLIRPAEPSRVRRCSADADLMKPFIRPADGQTYEDLRREGEEQYRRNYSHDG